MRAVVFDIDDTAWNLNGRICDLFGINMSLIENFYIKYNDKLSEKEKKLLIENYNNHEMFQDIEWYDGFTNIFELEKLGCKVFINSNCNTEAVRDVKHHEIVDKLGFDDSRVILNIVSNPKDKDLGDDIYIFVDDSPFNLAKSDAEYNIALRKPWNTSEAGKEIIGDKKVIYCDTLLDAIEIIRKLLIGANEYENYTNQNQNNT